MYSPSLFFTISVLIFVRCFHRHSHSSPLFSDWMLSLSMVIGDTNDKATNRDIKTEGLTMRYLAIVANDGLMATNTCCHMSSRVIFKIEIIFLSIMTKKSITGFILILYDKEDNHMLHSHPLWQGKHLQTLFLYFKL